LALIASAFFTKPGRWLLLQVGVNAPGTANSTTFLPLNNSSVVFGFGPSAVITVKVPVGTRSPTLIAMVRILLQGYGLRMDGETSALAANSSSRNPTSMALSPDTAVSRRLAPSGFSPGGRPS